MRSSSLVQNRFLAPTLILFSLTGAVACSSDSGNGATGTGSTNSGGRSASRGGNAAVAGNPAQAGLVAGTGGVLPAQVTSAGKPAQGGAPQGAAGVPSSAGQPAAGTTAKAGQPAAGTGTGGSAQAGEAATAGAGQAGVGAAGAPSAGTSSMAGAPGQGGKAGSGGNPGAGSSSTAGRGGSTSGTGGSGAGTAGLSAGGAGGAGNAGMATGGVGTAGTGGTTAGKGGTGGAAAAGMGGIIGSGGSGGSGGASACGETSGRTATRIYYVSPTGKSTNAGNSFAAPLDFTTALGAVTAGQMVLLAPGTYTIAYKAGSKNTINLTKSGANGQPIQIVASSCGRAVFDFSFPDNTWVQDSYGFYITGSYWYLKGIGVTRAGYQGGYVTGGYNTFEACSFYDNRNSGLELNEGGHHTTVINTDAYHNYDPKKYGGMADGFASKQLQGPGNHFIGCRSWENSDDGFDLFDSPETVVIENSWAFENGIDVWNYGGFVGNGNGFKLGGNQVLANNQLYASVAFGNRVKGIDQNNNSGGLTIHNCVSYNNGINFGLGNPVTSGQQHVLRNNISLGSTNSISNADAKYNSWNSGFSVSSADFVSVDTSKARVARNPDGTLPDSLTLFQLKATSKLIDAGTNVGRPYNGSAPDLGAFETP